MTPRFTNPVREPRDLDREAEIAAEKGDRERKIAAEDNQSFMTPPTNEELIQMIKPVLEQVAQNGFANTTNDVRIELADYPTLELKISAWSKSSRVFAPTLDSLPAAVAGFDHHAAWKEIIRERISKLDAERADLEKELAEQH